ncbi:MAG: hypothetical protein JRE45_09525 [Deltaproteobacteria bacterium]|nr:hypothetical protein [Deltaproteobacteria bacterium]
MTHLRLGLLTILACAVLSPSSAAVAEPPPVVLQAAVAFWKDGKAQGQVDAARADEEGNLLLDLGEEWTPYILTEAAGPDGQLKTSEYRSTYLALARGEFPEDRHGYRAQKDQYLELYGILPTLGARPRTLARVRRVLGVSKGPPPGSPLGPLRAAQATDGRARYARPGGKPRPGHTRTCH